MDEWGANVTPLSFRSELVKKWGLAPPPDT